jgi:hypothetical protein
MMHCVQCNTELVAPERSEYRSNTHICHVWFCPKCSSCFESLVAFPAGAGTKSMNDILTADPALLPSLLARYLSSAEDVVFASD